MTMLELRLVYTNTFIKKKSYKKSPVGPGGLSNLKITFVLLTKVIAVHMQFTIVYIWYLSFKKSLVLC